MSWWGRIRKAGRVILAVTTGAPAALAEVEGLRSDLRELRRELSDGVIDDQAAFVASVERATARARELERIVRTIKAAL